MSIAFRAIFLKFSICITIFLTSSYSYNIFLQHILTTINYQPPCLDHSHKYYQEHCFIKNFHIFLLELQFADGCFLHLYCDYYCLLLWCSFSRECSDVAVILCLFGSCIYICGIPILEYFVYFHVNELPSWIYKLYCGFFLYEDCNYVFRHSKTKKDLAHNWHH